MCCDWQTTNEVVLWVEFHPTDPHTLVTCGKSHIFFWLWGGSSLARKQGIFGVSHMTGSHDRVTWRYTTLTSGWFLI